MKPKKYKIILIATLAAFTFFSCTYRPRGILSERKMKEVLVDMHRADGIMQVSGALYSNDDNVAAYYKSVLDKHGITQAQFDSSLVWYTDNPNIFDKMYPSIIEQLETEHAAAQIIAQDEHRIAQSREEAIRKLDSILNIPLQPTQHVSISDYRDSLPKYDNLYKVYNIQVLDSLYYTQTQ